MVKITGSWEAFKEFTSHDENAKRAPMFYQLLPNGRVAKVLIDSSFEWTFPVNEGVTESWLRGYARMAVKVDNWIV